MPEFLSVDQIENGFAVLEKADRSIVYVPLQTLPQGVKAGDVLRLENGAYTLDPSEADRRRSENIRLFGKLRKGGNG